MRMLVVVGYPVDEAGNVNTNNRECINFCFPLEDETLGRMAAELGSLSLEIHSRKDMRPLMTTRFRWTIHETDFEWGPDGSVGIPRPE